MAIAFVQETAIASSSTASKVVTISAPTAGNALVLSAHIQSTTETITGVTDNAGNTWVKATNAAVTASGRYEIWYALNVSSSTTTVTITISIAKNVCGNLSEWSGVGAFSNANNATVTTSPNRTGTLSEAAGTLAVGGFSANSATARTLSSTGWTGLTAGTPPASFSGLEAYRITTGSETVEGQWTTASATSTGGGIATFTAASAGSTFVPPVQVVNQAALVRAHNW